MTLSDAFPLEREYLFRERHPDREAIYARQRALSDEARRGLRHLADLRYGAAPRATLDVFPAERPDAPILLFFHGGYWRSNDKRDVAFLAPPLVRAGVTLVLANYPLTPDATLPAIVDSATAALRWTAANAALWQGDGSNLHVAGHSAGGHLAALAASETAVRSCTGISGIYDLLPLRQTSLSRDLPSDEVTLRRLSPRHRVSSRPLHLYVGANETDAFRRQTQDFAAAAAQAGAPVTCCILPDLHHYDIVLSLADQDTMLFRQVLGRLDGRPQV